MSLQAKPFSAISQSVNTTVQAVTNVAAALAEFDTSTGTPVEISEGGMSAAPATAVVTAPDTGVYLCLLTATITPPAVTHTVTLSIQKATTNIGGTVNTHVCVASTEFTLATHAVVRLVAGETVRPAIVSSDAGPQNYTVDEATFTVIRIA